ncbi:hypothetical protein L3X38_027062 [Prunus dulcis]|uniref:PB1-like domain-containing protein n=1 Tax=Prunus dulcis TaxID=3755 RepID=A0AAD4YZX3_PRUDU|nr:hypothetical protein L3X38_027062 [Prunus dulcis]
MNFQLGFFLLIFSKILVIAHDDLVPPNKLDSENPSAGKPSLYEHHSNPDMFTLEVHHGGYFVDGLYMGGIVQWVDGQDADEVSMLGLFKLVKHLGYDEQNIQYYYKHRTNGWVEIRTDKDHFAALKLVKPSQLFVLYIIDNPAPRPLNVQSPVFSAKGENAEHYEDEHTAHGYDGDEENRQYEFVDVEIDEEFGEVEEEVEVENDEAE